MKDVYILQVLVPGTSIIQQQSTGIPRGIDIHQLPDYAVLYMERMLSFHLNDSKLQVEPCGHKITTQASTLYQMDSSMTGTHHASCLALIQLLYGILYTGRPS